MQHPLLSNKKNLYAYLIAWILISSIHAIILKLAYTIPIGMAITDACISNILLAFMGIVCWYTVRFISIDSGQPLLIVFNHVISAALFLLLWHTAVYFLLSHSTTDVLYLSWLQLSNPFRIIGGLFFYCIIALSYYLYKYTYSLKERIKKEADWNTLVKEGELALLKSQLQPHFIFNSLNSIHALMQTSPERAQDMVLNLAAFLRLSMSKDERKLVSLSEELENSTLYSNIEKIRFGNRLQIETHIEKDAFLTQVPHMILQPLIENAIKHGLSQNTGSVAIKIEAAIRDHSLYLSISNKYDPKAVQARGTGLGLKHVRRRLIILYGRKDLVQIKDENSIFQIEIRIPQYS